MRSRCVRSDYGASLSLADVFWPIARGWQSLHFTALCLCGLMVIVLSLDGCQLSQSAFTRTVNNAGGAFAAASITLTYAHQGKITNFYARSSFLNYQSELAHVDQQLPSQKGVSDTHIVSQLLDVYRPAMGVINQPCLEDACDWHLQVKVLDRASQAFLKAGGQ